MVISNPLYTFDVCTDNSNSLYRVCTYNENVVINNIFDKILSIQDINFINENEDLITAIKSLRSDILSRKKYSDVTLEISETESHYHTITLYSSYGDLRWGSHDDSNRHESYSPENKSIVEFLETFNESLDLPYINLYQQYY